MPAAQRQTPATAFRDTAAADSRRASIRATARVGLAQPGTPAEKPKRHAAGSPARPRMQTAWFAFMLTAGMVVTMIGLFYLSGHASVTREGYRRAKLVGRLRQEQARRQTLDALKARAAAPGTIEAKARALHMIRAADDNTLTVGVTLNKTVTSGVEGLPTP